MVHCAGCRSEFTLSGYTTHLQRTANPSCQRINDQNMRDLPDDSDDEEDQAPAVQFAGDYFGTYQEEDFDMDQNAEPADPNDSENLDEDEMPKLQEVLFSDSESEDEGEDDFDGHWEPNVPALDFEHLPGVAKGAGVAGIAAAAANEHDEATKVPTPAERAAGEEQVQFTDGDAGAPLRRGEPGYESYKAKLGDPDNVWAPFTSKLEWELAQWAKLRGPGSTAFTDLLKIGGITERLGLSYKNSRELNNIIDSKIPGRPKFKRKEVIVGGEAYDVYFRDILECVRALYGDPEFAAHLKVAPERHYADEDQTIRLYHDMHTGKWWWATQRELEKRRKGATVIPIIISSDKTLLTLFRNRTAYPVYLTIGNIPKDIRRKPSRQAQILLAYLPTSKLEHITVKASRRRILTNLFHTCMAKILEPLKGAGSEGMVVVSGDGVARRGHPILAAYVGDYPEQLLVGCVKNMDCPQCPEAAKNLGDAPVAGEPEKFRDLNAILDALAAFDEDPAEFVKKCKAAGIKPVIHPFWEGLPFVDIYKSITPDVLHQLYQGVMKHLKAWIIEAFGAAEIDARCRRLPPNHNIRNFMNGISHISRVTGQEHDQMCRFLLGIIIDIPLPKNLNSGRLIRSVRALLDFLYLSQYPVHSTETLAQQDDALARFHENKGIFIDLGIRTNFNLPKLHFLRHYSLGTKRFGTTDNFNTETTERLHIDFAKDAYRATNHKDEYPQMTRWLERKEKILLHAKFIRWRELGQPSTPSVPPGIEFDRTLKMTLHPTRESVPFDKLIQDYGAQFFRDALARFVVSTNHPEYSARQIETYSANLAMPFRRVPVYHKIKWVTEHLPDATIDSVHATPVTKNTRGKPVPGRFDTVLVNLGTGKETGVDGYRVGQVRCIFSIPEKQVQQIFNAGITVPKYLVYIEWFTAFKSRPEPNHLLYKISRAENRDGDRMSSIIPIDNIRRSVHLFPKFGLVAPREWTSSNVLEECATFFVSCFTDRHSYVTIY
ncbi:hypothetical protein B0H16DRAFT_1663370 [Mycena metata]|uniref:Uncharacterized protein n=1 Tax=Mycena metata TaxID=1033252 RepID=A0AAD7ITR7_9AGAR|nr:hypothetical protein B0H16DRAFT_1663370 [Mycena metata]